jgi:hypothetical protein
MGFFQRIAHIFSSPNRPDEASDWIAAKCSRCGEVIRARVDLRNDLSIEYGEGDGKPTYFTRKVLIGESGRCFQRIEVELTFDANKNLINREISGGQFVDV